MKRDPLAWQAVKLGIVIGLCLVAVLAWLAIRESRNVRPPLWQPGVFPAFDPVSNLPPVK